MENFELGFVHYWADNNNYNNKIIANGNFSYHIFVVLRIITYDAKYFTIHIMIHKTINV